MAVDTHFGIGSPDFTDERFNQVLICVHNAVTIEDDHCGVLIAPPTGAQYQRLL